MKDNYLESGAQINDQRRFSPYKDKPTSAWDAIPSGFLSPENWDAMALILLQEDVVG